MSSEQRFVRVERNGAVATVTLDRQDRFNAFDGEVLAQLEDALMDVGRDSAVRAVILTGAGKAFCAGGDLKAVLKPGKSPGEWFYLYASTFHQCINELRTMPKPVIGAINGVAAGGGFSLALACDLRVMGESAYMRQAYTSNGLTMDGGGTFMLPRLVGIGRALEIAMLDEKISSGVALELGLVNRVVADGRLRDAAMDLALNLAGRATETLARIKLLMNSSFETSLGARLEEERRQLGRSADSLVGLEGLSAFEHKRAPDFVAAARGEGHRPDNAGS